MISIIIPTYNEEKTIADTLDRVKGLEGAFEIILVDGGSRDRTTEISTQHVKVITSEKGRGNQMNCGAQHANGDILWFVHSDALLEKESISAIANAVASGCIGGCLSLYFHDYPTLFMKWLAWSSNLRAKHLKLMFGDQGIFVRKDVFDKLQGFKSIPIMEDWDFSKRLSAQGPVRVVKARIGTSARRFQSGGQLRTLLKMHKIKYKYLRGVPPEDLIKEYKEIR